MISQIRSKKIVTSKKRAYLVALKYVTLISISFSNAGTVLADDYISPDLVKITTPRYSPERSSFKPRLGTYEYSVGWEGINAASCAVTISRAGDAYVIDAAARTYSGVDLLYKLRYEAVGTIDAKTFTSRRLTIDHRENSRLKKIDISFAPDLNAIHAERGKSAEDPDKKVLDFVPYNFTLDPIAAAFLARSLEWKVGDTKHFDVFNGKSRYFISLSAVDRKTIKFQGQERPVIVISPQVRNVTTTKPRSKLREAFMYVSDDDYREVLRIESSVFIGRVITELDSFTPAASQPDSPLQLVQASNDDELESRQPHFGDDSARAQMR